MSFLQLQVTWLDGNSVNNEQVLIDATNLKGTKLYKKAFQVVNGMVTFDIPEISWDTKELVISVSLHL